MSDLRNEQIDKFIRYSCESADSMSYAFGHHMLELASKQLEAMCKLHVVGVPAHSPQLTQMYATVKGYLAQYEQWMVNNLNGHTSKESKQYEEAINTIYSHLQSQRKLSTSNGDK